ncbi:MAG: D-Ala-D-Ala carboxypeptidase family metallohydrolase [Candidatus Magnetominusculus sp. LBB02]|nr:D-Ala-D-Ala carboxypeptidase family metallohydrolase [Candidatus Magnetominusculus sp. LBB02]
MAEQTENGQGQTAAVDSFSKYFRAEEFTCRCGCGLNNISAALVARLDKIRETADIALKITSGSRCKAHNAAVGGKADSAHLDGLAADIAIANSNERFLIAKAAIANGIKRLGVGTALIHLDIDKIKPQEALWLYA